MIQQATTGYHASGGGAEAFTWSVTKDFNGLKALLAYSTVDAEDIYPLTSTPG